MTGTLSEKRKADRLEMAARLTEALQAAGATVKRNPDLEQICKRAVYLDISTARGLSVTVDFDGESTQPDVYVLSWYFADSRSRDKISDNFSQSVNACHRHKATHVAYGFDDLRDTLLRGVRMAQDGSAFLP